MTYRLTVHPAKFWVGWKPGYRIFAAPDDDAAIRQAEYPSTPIKFIVPSEGTCGAFPMQLEEIDLTPQPDRLVKQW